MSFFKIWIDADACPNVIKEIIYRAATRLKIHVCLVANKALKIPRFDFISFVCVEFGLDVADSYIINHLSAGDIVVTADIPLAALVVKKEAIGIDPRGTLYTESNVQERLSIRNFMMDLRSEGAIRGGPAALDKRVSQAFAASLDKVLNQKMRAIR